MWERATLKQRAKAVLKGSYWKAFLVTIVMGVASGGGGGSVGSRSSSGDLEGALSGIQMEGTAFWVIVSAVIIGVLVLAVIMTAISIFLGNIVTVGGKRYFIQAAQEDVDMGYLGYGFKSGRYLSIVKSMLWKGLFQFLWTLLFIIPGIIKAYSYYMVPYILADNPEIGYKRALKLSMEMMDGEKWKLFVLKLSFIGWYFLGILACFVGMVFVKPYQEATEAELYLFLRDKAIRNGLCDYRELNLVKRTVESDLDLALGLE